MRRDPLEPRPGHALLSRVRRLLGLVPALDLHGLGVPDALRATEEFLRDALRLGHREVRIVYGKGRGSPGGIGVLRRAIPGWLEQHAGVLVARFERELDADGQDGAMRVWLGSRPAPRGTREVPE
jgi:DNA-nicking Smr family endonuclease